MAAARARAVELARRVAPTGRVHGVDLNKAFLESARVRAKRDGVEALIDWRLTDGDHIRSIRGWRIAWSART